MIRSVIRLCLHWNEFQSLRFFLFQKLSGLQLFKLSRHLSTIYLNFSQETINFFFIYLEHATANIADICKVFTSLYMSDLALSVLQKWCKFSSTTTTMGNNLQSFVCISTWRRRPYLFLVRTPIPQRYRDLTYSYCCPRKCIILRKINGAPSCSFENKFTFFGGSFKCFIDGLRTKEKEQPKPQHPLRIMPIAAAIRSMRARVFQQNQTERLSV